MFNQEALELLFGHIRGRFGYNIFPNYLKLKYAICSILLQNFIKMSTENYTLFMSNNSLLSLKYNYKDK